METFHNNLFKEIYFMNKSTLSSLDIGEKGTVSGITESGGMRRRFQDIGIIPGTEIECLQKSPSGDPKAYCIRGVVMAIRKEDGEKILLN